MGENRRNGFRECLCSEGKFSFPQFHLYCLHPLQKLVMSDVDTGKFRVDYCSKLSYPVSRWR